MIKKMDKENLIGHGPIKMLYPGLSLSNKDTGIASIGRIDHALFEGNTVISMHPHVNDEILTYLRSGYIEHIDSEGFEASINNNKLMLMKAGASFFHEEKIIDKGEHLEGLQIFIRPATKDLRPEVTFRELEQAYSPNQWRLLASPSEETSLQFSSQTWIYDRKADKKTSFELPILANKNLSCLLYVFSGEVCINDSINLEKKDSVVIKEEAITIHTKEGTELVLFVTDENKEFYDGGMYSGNKANG